MEVEERKDRKERIEELYENLYSYLERLKDLCLLGDKDKDKSVIGELIELYLKDSMKLSELLIREGKIAGQIDNADEIEMRNYHLENLKINEKILRGEIDI